MHRYVLGNVHGLESKRWRESERSITPKRSVTQIRSGKDISFSILCGSLMDETQVSESILFVFHPLRFTDGLRILCGFGNDEAFKL